MTARTDLERCLEDAGTKVKGLPEALEAYKRDVLLPLPFFGPLSMEGAFVLGFIQGYNKGFDEGYEQGGQEAYDNPRKPSR